MAYASLYVVYETGSFLSTHNCLITTAGRQQVLARSSRQQVLGCSSRQQVLARSGRQQVLACSTLLNNFGELGAD